MKISLTFLFLLIFCKANSQVYHDPVQPNRFDDAFIRKPSIEWAAYVDDTIKFNHPNLSDLLIQRMEKGEVKTAYPHLRNFSSGDLTYFVLNNLNYTTKEQNHQMFYPCCIDYMYDSLGRELRDTIEKPVRKIDDHTRDLLWVSQILFVEDGKLKSYIPWVAPTFSVVVSDSIYIGTDTYFATCLNFKYDFISAGNDKNIFLGKTTKRFWVDSLFKTETLKQIYGRNILQSILSGVFLGKAKIYDASSGKKILPPDLKYFPVSSKPFTVDVYDSTGRVIGTKYQNENPLLYYVTEFKIVQNWYYNHTKNIVTCKIPEMYLYIGRDNDYEVVKTDDRPSLKIVF